MQIGNGIHKQFYPVGPGVKPSVRVAYNQQQQSPKMKEKPAVTTVNVYCCCCQEQLWCQI